MAKLPKAKLPKAKPPKAKLPKAALPKPTAPKPTAIKATPPKATPAPILPKALDSQLTKALGLVGSKHYTEAMEIFRALVGPAKESGNIALQRTLHNYLVVCEHKSSKSLKGAAGPEGEAQWLLNKKDSNGALALLEKSIKAAPTSGILHFLKATAHAQLGDAEASAEALNRSMLLNGDLLHLYRLETDFDNVRNMAPFAAIERS